MLKRLYTSRDERVPCAATYRAQGFYDINPGFPRAKNARFTPGYRYVSLTGFFNEVSLIYIRARQWQFHVMSFDGEAIQTDGDSLAITGLCSSLSAHWFCSSLKYVLFILEV